MGKEPLGFAIPSQAEGFHRNGSGRSWVDPTAPRCCCTPEPFPALAAIGCQGHNPGRSSALSRVTLHWLLGPGDAAPALGGS